MTRQEAIERARSIAGARQWPWLEPVDVRRRRRFLFGPLEWEVVTNAGSRGLSIRVVLDDRTGRPRESVLRPR